MTKAASVEGTWLLWLLPLRVDSRLTLTLVSLAPRPPPPPVHPPLLSGQRTCASAAGIRCGGHQEDTSGGHVGPGPRPFGLTESAWKHVDGDDRRLWLCFVPCSSVPCDEWRSHVDAEDRRLCVNCCRCESPGVRLPMLCESQFEASFRCC